MKKEEIEKLSTEELIKKEKSLKMSAGILTGLLIVLFAATIYSTYKSGKFDVLMVVAIALSTVCFRNYKIAKEMREEISRRG